MIKTLREQGHVQNSPHRGTKLKSVVVVVLVCGGLLLQKSLAEVADTMVENVLVVQTDSCEVTWKPKNQQKGFVEVEWSSGLSMTANATVDVNVIKTAAVLVCPASHGSQHPGKFSKTNKI